jgi:hypothetical protein
MIRRAMAGLLLLGAAAGCGKKDIVQPVAGDLTVSYTGPSQTDGALLVVVNGTVTAVHGVGGYQVASAPAGTTSTRVVITGSLNPGDILRVSVPDVAAVATYSAVVEAAADRNTYSLGDPLAYHANLRK